MLVLAAATALLSCSPNRKPFSLEDFQVLVFPGEAELGGTAFAVIGSNYIPDGDAFESYDLERSRVGVDIRDASSALWPATVRAVTPVQASAISRLANTRPGAWATLVVFDLPTDPAFNLGSNPSYLANVVVNIDGIAMLDDLAIGSIRITGRAGASTQMMSWPALAELELDGIVARFRPVLDGDSSPGGGFPNEPGGTVIGGLEADLVYYSPCYTDPEVYGDTEAANAGIHVGPQQTVPGGGSFVYRRIVLTSPQGITLAPPAGGVEGALGEGPLIDVAFGRPNQSAVDCAAAEAASAGLLVWLWNVQVVRPDGTAIVDQRGTGTVGASSDLFARFDIPRPSGEE